MTDSENKTMQDILGIAPVSRAIERATDSVFGGAEAVLGRICLPAAEEFGLLLRDKVGEWRRRNLLATVAKASKRLDEAAGEGRHAPPRLVMESLTHASWTESEQVQEMWAGLLASSCTLEGNDDSNWIFINILGQLTTMQAVLIKAACEQAQKIRLPTGLIAAESLHRTGDELRELAATSDLQRIDRELDHLVALGLLAGGFLPGFAKEPLADIRPTALALYLYVRSQGSTEDPIRYFGLADAADASA